MKYNPEIHHRRSIRLPNHDYSQPGMYFVTINVYKKQCLLGEIVDGDMVLSDYGKIVNDFLLSLKDKYENIELVDCIVMPNHVHLLVSIISDVGAIHELPLHDKNNHMNRRKMLIPKVVGYLKMNTAKTINQCRDIKGQQFWQRNYHEHIIRDLDDLNKIRQYIRTNPLKWELDENYMP